MKFLSKIWNLIDLKVRQYKKKYEKYHRIKEWFGLEGTLKIITVPVPYHLHSKGDCEKLCEKQ